MLDTHMTFVCYSHNASFARYFQKISGTLRQQSHLIHLMSLQDLHDIHKGLTRQLHSTRLISPKWKRARPTL